MFSGLVQARGRLSEAPQASGQGGVRLVLEHDEGLSERLTTGSSLAVQGVCLTVTENTPGQTTVELSPETLRRTLLGDLTAGAAVNLEPALRVGDELGGHWVQGHVDGTTEIVARHDLGDHREVWLALDGDLAAYVVEKGSIAVDGVSLTVAALAADRFAVALIPHTLDVTTLGGLTVGDRVHLEVDVLAKYVERAVARALGTATH